MIKNTIISVSYILLFWERTFRIIQDNNLKIELYKTTFYRKVHDLNVSLDLHNSSALKVYRMICCLYKKNWFLICIELLAC